jgi:glycine/D-amino acid oxidase-like deaminating enzyme
VAAGLFNPITGRKFVKTWKADVLFPFLSGFYNKAEHTLGARFFHPMNIYRPFVSIEEQNEWSAKASEPDFQHFIKEVRTQTIDPDLFTDHYGGILLNQSGYLDIKTYLSSARNFFTSLGVFEESYISSLDVAGPTSDDGFRKIILCDGLGSLTKKYFDFLPFRPVKGELLEVKSETHLNFILNRGVFVIPINKGMLRVGSTYNHQVNLEKTRKGRNEIINRLSQIFQPEISVHNHYVGVRPATKDRRPFLGIHPENKRWIIFNGMGSKGASLTPYLAFHLIEHLEKGRPLESAVDIKRFVS